MHTSSLLSVDPRKNRYTIPTVADLVRAVDPIERTLVEAVIKGLGQIHSLKQSVSWEGRSWGWSVIFRSRTRMKGIEWFVVARTPAPFVSIRIDTALLQGSGADDCRTLVLQGSPDTHRHTGRTLWCHWTLENDVAAQRVIDVARRLYASHAAAVCS